MLLRHHDTQAPREGRTDTRMCFGGRLLVLATNGMLLRHHDRSREKAEKIRECASVVGYSF